MTSNALTGPLPASVSHLGITQYFYAASNKLSGALPAGIAGMASLQALDLSNNGLSGYIPASIYLRLEGLHSCGLGGNPFACPEPSAVVQDCNVDSC